MTTHPSAFRTALATVDWSLRHQAHPNFIRWTICNGNPPRQKFARQLGIAGIVGGLICAVLLTVSSASRAWRVLSAIGFVVGIATLFAAWKGMCVVSTLELLPISASNHSRSFMACIIAIFDHGSSS